MNERFIERMEDVLELYTRPYDEDEPVICFDEKSKQLLKDTRNQLPMRPGKTRRRDYEYKRNGTQNIFVAVEPKAGYRRVTVTDRRTKSDFAKEIKKLIELSRYKQIKTIHIVLDNLNTHFPTSFYETFTQPVADRLLERIMFHYTPTHASWLNMAEIELSILSRQALNQRIATKEQLIETARTYQKRRNKQWATISWKFTKKDARKVFKYDRKN